MHRLPLFFLLLCLAGCEKPGEGPKAARGFRRTAPLIAALAAYHTQHRSYPKTLQQLVPRHLPAASLRPPLAPEQPFPFEYRRTPDGYRLGFRYQGPGMNVCTYRSGSGRWTSHGYY